jgi:uncharacterized protein (DUF2147 family)
MIKLLLVSLLLSWTSATGVEGVWVTQDDETGKQKSEVRLYRQDGKLYGKIEKLLLPEDKGKVCTACSGAEKGKPIEGMLILKGLRQAGQTWEDGTILDPKSGKVYDCYVELVDDNTLKVRGYLGFSLLGRTQTWKRKN